MVDLDREALQIAQQLVENISAGGNKDDKKIKELENQFTKSLGILTESGVYALFVYLLAKRKKEKRDGGAVNDPCHEILNGLFNALKGRGALCATLGLNDNIPSLGVKPEEGDAKKVLDWVAVQVGDLGRLLLLRDFLLRTFTYGRYCAAARKTELKAGSSEAGGGGVTP